MREKLGFGAGLRPQHYVEIDDVERARETNVRMPDWFEALSENYLVPGGQPRAMLRRARERGPIVLHGVSLSIGAVAPLDEAYLSSLAALVDEIEPAYVSDHLCWSRHGGHYFHDLWPLPMTMEAVEHVSARVAQVQERLGRPILLENVSTYASFAESAIGEAQFLSEVCARTGCGLLLDVNNVYVSARNLGLDADAYIAALPAERVAQIHLAGHSDHGDYVLDTHDAPVCDDVWALYRRTIALLGEVPTMIEWDEHIPPFARLCEEVDRARAAAASVLT